MLLVLPLSICFYSCSGEFGFLCLCTVIGTLKGKTVNATMADRLNAEDYGARKGEKMGNHVHTELHPNATHRVDERHELVRAS